MSAGASVGASVGIGLNRHLDPVWEGEAAHLEVNWAHRKSRALGNYMVVVLKINGGITVLIEEMHLKLIFGLGFERTEWTIVNGNDRFNLEIEECSKDIQGADFLDIFCVF